MGRLETSKLVEITGTLGGVAFGAGITVAYNYNPELVSYMAAIGGFTGFNLGACVGGAVTDNKIGCPTFSGAIVGGGVGAIGGIVGSIVGIPGAIVGGILGGAIGGNVVGKIAGEETLKEPNKFLK